MNSESPTQLPKTWTIAPLEDLALINPKLDKSHFDDALEVSFVPMPAVEAETGKIAVSQIRKFGEVKKGYTAFRENDVLFAKITPCMENGKMAVVPELKNKLGFGSTEFHVIRAHRGIVEKYLYYLISSQQFRRDAEHNMTGAVGQRRVPAPYLSKQVIAVPPSAEQRRIVAKIEELFSELDKGVESLTTAREQLKAYRQSVLKHAFEGKLHEDWRAQNADKLESPETLLERIKEEREERYKQALRDWETSVEKWKADGEEGKKPAKPKRPKEIDPKNITEDEQPNVSPDWGITRLGNLNCVVSDGPFGSNLKTSDYTATGVRVIRLENIGYGEFLENKRSYVSHQKYEQIKKHTVFPGTIIVSSFVTDGVRSCRVPEILERAINKADCFAVEISGNQSDRKFVALYLQTPQAFKQLDELIHGVGRPRINTTQLKEVHIPVCAPSEQKEIVRLLEEKLEVADVMEAEIDAALARADALRQSILKRAFSGQLVEQDPADEPASVLLERIRAEKEKAAPKAKKRRTKKNGKKEAA